VLPFHLNFTFGFRPLLRFDIYRIQFSRLSLARPDRRYFEGEVFCLRTSLYDRILVKPLCAPFKSTLQRSIVLFIGVACPISSRGFLKPVCVSAVTPILDLLVCTDYARAASCDSDAY